MSQWYGERRGGGRSVARGGGGVHGGWPDRRGKEDPLGLPQSAEAAALLTAAADGDEQRVRAIVTPALLERKDVTLVEESSRAAEARALIAFARTPQGHGALHLASYNNCPEVLALLLEAGADASTRCARQLSNDPGSPSPAALLLPRTLTSSLNPVPSVEQDTVR